MIAHYTDCGRMKMILLLTFINCGLYKVASFKLQLRSFFHILEKLFDTVVHVLDFERGKVDLFKLSQI